MRIVKKRQISEKNIETFSSNSDDIIISAIKKNDLIKLAKKIAVHLKEQHNISLQEALKTEEIPEESLPVEIFATKLSPAEAVVKYLKENCKLRFRDIALMLNRDERSVWGSYDRAKQKIPSSLKIIKSVVRIPVSILKDRRIAMLESVVFYLKETRGISVGEIAHLMNKAQTTIYTVYSRAKQKIGGGVLKTKTKNKEVKKIPKIFRHTNKLGGKIRK